MVQHDQYLATQVMTAEPAELHLMVVDGALRAARRGLRALEEQDREQSYLALDESRKLVSELISGLDPEHAPEMVQNMKALFVFAFRSLALAEIDRDPQQVRNALQVLELHRETWLQLMARLKQLAENTAPAPAFARSEPAAAPARGRSWSV